MAAATAKSVTKGLVSRVTGVIIQNLKIRKKIYNFNLIYFFFYQIGLDPAHLFFEVRLCTM